MATSGTIEGSFSGSGKAGQKPYIFWEQTSCSVADNTSTIKVTFKVKRVGTDYSTNKSKAPWTISIGSNSSSGTKDYKISSVGSGSYVTIGTYTKTVSHNANGTLSIALKATLNLSGTTAGTGTVSGSITLPTIARTSSASPSASSVTTGSSVQINISRKGSSFTHNVSYKLEGLSTTYTTGLSASSGIATACTFTPPHSLFKSLTTKTSVKATVTVTTMNGSTAVGSVNFSLTINLHESAKPVISAVTLTRVAGASTTASFGIYIQSLDCVNVVTAAAMNPSYDSGGTVTVTVTVEGKTYTGTNITSSVLNVAGAIAITVTAKDSRGRSVSLPKEISVAAYAAPRITKFLAFRAASATAVTEDAKGTYARMTGAWEYAALNGKNGITATYSIQQKGGTVVPVTSGAAINTYYTASGVSISSTWTITLKLQDTVGNAVTDEMVLLSGAKSMSFKNDGTGIAIGKYAEQAGLEVDWNSSFNKETKFNERVNFEYPGTTYEEVENQAVHIIHHKKDNNASNPSVMRFQAIIDNTVYHDVAIWQGNHDKPYGLGLWDKKNGRGISFYDDINNRIYFYTQTQTPIITISNAVTSVSPWTIKSSYLKICGNVVQIFVDAARASASAVGNITNEVVGTIANSLYRPTMNTAICTANTGPVATGYINSSGQIYLSADHSAVTTWSFGGTYLITKSI